MLDPVRYEMSKVYTPRLTARGDSGAALYDSDDRLIGFAFRHTAYNSRLKASVWVWAEQVYDEHGLFGHATN